MFFGVVVLLYFLPGVSIASEPQCSPFHYEEKTLEKLIKLEIFVQKIKDDIDAIDKRVSDTLRSLVNESEKLNLDWENEKEIAKKELKEMKEVTRAEIQMAEEAIKNVTDSATTPTVAFVAKMSIHRGLSTSQIIQFKDIIINEGNGYDASTGVFTAPVAGTYMFTVQFCTPSGDGIGFAVMSKNKVIKLGWMKDSDDDNCHSADAVDVLNNRDHVWIKCTDSVASYQGSAWNAFSGVLLHK